MKRLILFSLCAMVCVVCDAQKILSDLISQGYRVVSTTDFNQGGIATTDTRLGYSAMAMSKDEKHDYYLRVHVYSYTPVYAKFSPLLIRCGNGEVLELQSEQADEHDRIGDFSSVTGFTTYNILLNFKVDESDIEALRTGMTKLRIGVVQNGTDVFERTFTDKHCKKLSERFTKAFTLIDDALAKDKDFTDGF